MPPVLSPVSYEQMRAVKVLSSQGNSPVGNRQFGEIATSTYKIGVPVYLNGGFVAEANFGSAIVILGVSIEDAHNYATSGVAIDLNERTPPNQPSALTIPMGARIRDGKMGIYEANGQNVFSIALKVGQTFTAANAGNTYGLTKDATSGFWFCDTTVVSGNSQVFIILEVDPSCPNDGVNGTRVFGIFTQAKRFYQ